MSSKPSFYYPLAIDREDKNKIIYEPCMFKIYVTGSTFYTLKLPDITPDLLTLKKREDCLRLEKTPLVFYQCSDYGYWIRKHQQKGTKIE